MYARQFCTNNPSHKIYCCMSERSTRHHTLLHNPTIIHTKTFSVPACHPRKIYRCIAARSTRYHVLPHNPTILHTKIFCASLSTAQENIIQDKTVTVFTDTPTLASHVIVHFKIRLKHKCRSKIFPFYFFRVRVMVTVRVRLTVQSATRLK